MRLFFARSVLPLAAFLALSGCRSDSRQEAVELPRSSPGATAATPGAPDPWKHPEIRDELKKDRETPRHVSDDGGTARVILPGERERRAIPAGGRERFLLEYEAGPEGVAEGGSIFLQVSPFWGWEPPQLRGPQAGGYTEVSTEAEGVLLDPRSLGQGLLQVTVRGRALDAGEKIRIDYGAGPQKARVDRYAEKGSRFWFAVDGNGDGVRKLIADSPSVDIVARPASRLHLALPGTARPSEEVELVIALLDASGNAGMPFEGKVEFVVDGEENAQPQTVEFVAADRGHKRVPLRAPREGVLRISAMAQRAGSEEPGPAATSNPLVVDEAADGTLLWGDLQVHTQLSDGSGTSLENLEYARDVAGLDVISLTDHDHWGLEALDDFPGHWQRQLEEVQRFHEPGKFVTLPGFEWTNWVEGHRHVIFFEEEEPVLFSSVDERYETPPQLWEALRGRDAMTIAHHSAGGPVPIDWSIPPDPELELVTEVVSVHGSSEAPDSPSPIYRPKPGNFVRDALDRGYRLGFLGSSDGHDGHPGLAQIAAGGKSGVAGIWARGESPRSRAAVGEALRARRAYATSGPRIFLDVRLDGLPMGSVLDAPRSEEAEGPQRLEWNVAAEAPIERIDILRRNARPVSIPGNGARDLQMAADIDALAPGDWLYLRVVQVDGGAAFSSPFFVLEEDAAADQPAG